MNSVGVEPATDQPLRVDLEIELPAGLGCAVADVDGEVTGVSQELKECGRGADTEGAGSYGECHAEVSLEDGGEVRREYRRSAVESGCVCRVFEEVDCIPNIRSVEDGRLAVSLALPDRDTLREVVGAVRATGASVRLERVVQRDDDGERTVEIDAREITPKQREAVEVAVEEGYYDEPREADLGELADRLGVSKSAVSQRLNAVESKLVLSLAGEG